LGADAPSEEVFLNLLVAQLQNQDPMNPADSTQFVTQLAQFSELEQVIAIRGDIESEMAIQNAASSSSTSSTGSTGSTGSSDSTGSQGSTGGSSDTNPLASATGTGSSSQTT
jgi:flagellar basal-body rod modification protein FlgD